MKVLIVSQPASDGVLRHVDLLCRYLLTQGMQVHLAYSSRNGREQLHDLVTHVAGHGGRTLDLDTGNAPQWADLRAMRALRRLIREVHPDIIHAHSSKAGGLVRGLGLLGLGIPTFYTPHAYFRMHDRKNWKARTFHLAERWLGTVGTSIGMGPHEAAFARDILKVPSARHLVIPAGIDTDEFCPATPERKQRLREKFGIPTDVTLLGTVGRFSLQKDPETMYAALARALPEASHLHFAHLGSGELEPQIDAFLAGHPIAKKITRVRYLADSAQFYQMLDGFILTSRYEGLSYAAQEAFACNLSAVLTDAPGNADLDIYGFSHVTKATPGDVESVSRAILTWYREAEKTTSPNHRQVVLSHLSKDICNSRVLAAYQRAISKQGDSSHESPATNARPGHSCHPQNA